jgi:hypothetical protein
MNSLHRKALTLAIDATRLFTARGSFPSNAYTTAQNRNAEAQAALISAIAVFAGVGGNVISTLNAAKTTSDSEKATLDAHG